MCYHYVSINNIKNQAFFQTILLAKTYRMNQCQTQLEKSWKFEFVKKEIKQISQIQHLWILPKQFAAFWFLQPNSARLQSLFQSTRRQFHKPQHNQKTWLYVSWFLATFQQIYPCDKPWSADCLQVLFVAQFCQTFQQVVCGADWQQTPTYQCSKTTEFHLQCLKAHQNYLCRVQLFGLFWHCFVFMQIKMFKRDISPRVDTSKSTARYDTSRKIDFWNNTNKVIKRKRICPKFDKSSFYDHGELTPCPTSPKAPGFGACVAPKVFSFFFDSKKEYHKNIFGTLCCTCFCACSKMTMYRAIPQTTHPLLPQGVEVIFISQKKIA